MTLTFSLPRKTISSIERYGNGTDSVTFTDCTTEYCGTQETAFALNSKSKCVKNNLISIRERKFVLKFFLKIQFIKPNFTAPIPFPPFLKKT